MLGVGVGVGKEDEEAADRSMARGAYSIRPLVVDGVGGCCAVAVLDCWVVDVLAERECWSGEMTRIEESCFACSRDMRQPP